MARAPVEKQCAGWKARGEDGKEEGKIKTNQYRV